MSSTEIARAYLVTQLSSTVQAMWVIRDMNREAGGPQEPSIAAISVTEAELKIATIEWLLLRGHEVSRFPLVLHKDELLEGVLGARAYLTEHLGELETWLGERGIDR